MRRDLGAELIEVIAYLAGSARTVLDETQRSGALRMLRAIQMLIRLSATEKVAGKNRVFLSELDKFIEENRDLYLTSDQKGFEKFLDELVRKVVVKLQSS